MCFYTWLEGECILNMHMKENVCLCMGCFWLVWAVFLKRCLLIWTLKVLNPYILGLGFMGNLFSYLVINCCTIICIDSSIYLSTSIYLSICPSIYLSMYISIFISHLYDWLMQSHDYFAYLSTCGNFVSVHLSIYLYTYLLQSTCIYLTIYLYIYRLSQNITISIWVSIAKEPFMES